jgi:hypothetical protein
MRVLIGLGDCRFWGQFRAQGRNALLLDLSGQNCLTELVLCPKSSIDATAMAGFGVAPSSYVGSHIPHSRGDKGKRAEISDHTKVVCQQNPHSDQRFSEGLISMGILPLIYRQCNSKAPSPGPHECLPLPQSRVHQPPLVF